ncbi:MAG: serine/threonine protein kinase [Planctomycetota bacterium]|nr:MAG: serine/threonine protein kinase [Planctomycetota bacterium]
MQRRDMSKEFNLSDSSDEILTRMLAVGVDATDPDDETSVEMFMKSALVDKGYITRHQLIEVMDEKAFAGQAKPFTAILDEKGLVTDKQFGELLRFFIEASVDKEETRDNLFRKIDTFESGAGSSGAKHADIWKSLEKHEKEIGRLSFETLECLLAGQDITEIMDAGASPAQTAALKDLDRHFIGKKIGSCEIIEKIGSGGMGVIYRARHTRLNKTVAVKILSPSLMKESHKKRFLREARAAASIEHPNVVMVYDVGEEKGYSYIVMQLVDGKSVKKILEEKGKLEPAQALLILQSAAKGLGAAHEKNIIHRDLKPDNIMITATGEVKVTDFGLAKGVSDIAVGNGEGKDEKDSIDVTSAGAVVGTPVYMSPEQFRSEKLDIRSDIYSLGATFYHMLSGAPPFAGRTPSDLKKMHEKVPPAPLDSIVENIPPETARIVSRMLEKDPRARYENTAELITDLNRAFLSLAEKEAISRHTLVPETVAEKERPSRKWLVAAVTAAVLMIGVALFSSIYAVMKSNNHEPAKEKENKEEIVKQVIKELMAKRSEGRNRTRVSNRDIGARANKPSREDMALIKKMIWAEVGPGKMTEEQAEERWQGYLKSISAPKANEGTREDWLPGVLKERGKLTDEQIEKARGGVRRIIAEIEAEGEAFELNPELRKYFEKEVGLTDEQIKLLVGIASRLLYSQKNPRRDK